MWFELTYCIVTLPGRIAIRIRWSIGNVLSSTGDARTCVISGHIVFHFLGQDIFQKKACNITTHSKHDRIASNRWQFGIKITLNTNIMVKAFFFGNNIFKKVNVDFFFNILDCLKKDCEQIRFWKNDWNKIEGNCSTFHF